MRDSPSGRFPVQILLHSAVISICDDATPGSLYCKRAEKCDRWPMRGHASGISKSWVFPRRPEIVTISINRTIDGVFDFVKDMLSMFCHYVSMFARLDHDSISSGEIVVARLTDERI